MAVLLGLGVYSVTGTRAIPFPSPTLTTVPLIVPKDCCCEGGCSAGPGAGGFFLSSAIFLSLPTLNSVHFPTLHPNLPIRQRYNGPQGVPRVRASRSVPARPERPTDSTPQSAPGTRPIRP